MDPVQLIDRLAGKIVGALHNLLGVSYSEHAEHYYYSSTFLFADAAAIGTTITQGIRISQESAFVCTAIQCGARVDDTGVVVSQGTTDGSSAAATVTLPDAPFTLALTDGGSDRTLQNEAVDAGLAYSAIGGLRGTLGRPRLFKPNSNVTLTVALLKAAAANTGFDCRVHLLGFKVYKAGQGDATMRVA
jgi:hypothetical protein